MGTTGDEEDVEHRARKFIELQTCADPATPLESRPCSDWIDWRYSCTDDSMKKRYDRETKALVSVNVCVEYDAMVTSSGTLDEVRGLPVWVDFFEGTLGAEGQLKLMVSDPLGIVIFLILLFSIILVGSGVLASVFLAPTEDSSNARSLEI